MRGCPNDIGVLAAYQEHFLHLLYFYQLCCRTFHTKLNVIVIIGCGWISPSDVSSDLQLLLVFGGFWNQVTDLVQSWGNCEDRCMLNQIYIKATALYDSWMFKWLHFTKHIYVFLQNLNSLKVLNGPKINNWATNKLLTQPEEPPIWFSEVCLLQQGAERGGVVTAESFPLFVLNPVKASQKVRGPIRHGDSTTSGGAPGNPWNIITFCSSYPGFWLLSCIQGRRFRGRPEPGRLQQVPQVYQGHIKTPNS